MQLVVLGLNHKTAPVEVRECFSFSEEQIKAVFHKIHACGYIDECVILSTCNRTEMYAVVDNLDDIEILQRFLYDMAGTDEKIGDSYFFYYFKEECMRHLFEVASSLDSLVIGEGQILSQVKKAYWLAKDNGMTSTILNTLFNRAIAVGKKVRTETRIAFSAVSISYAAVELAKKVLGDLTASNVLVLGAGKMSELTARHLVENGVKTIFVSNRNFERAKQLADTFSGIAVPFENFIQAAINADIVITSTGAPHYIVRAWDVAHIMPKRNEKPIIFIDIAVPRDVEPEVAAIHGAMLYNIDDLEAVVESNMKTRELEALKARKIIEEELNDIKAKFRYLSFRPIMAQLTDKAEKIRQREVKRALAKWPNISEEEKKRLENMSKMLVRKLLRDPMMRINEVAGTEKEEVYVKTVKKLFKLNGIGEENCGKNSHRLARK